jgi:Cft2 family RNA processing exonuclease
LTPSIHCGTLSPHTFQVGTQLSPAGLINHVFSGRCQGLTITPFNAGHTLGGTIWKIRSPAVGTIVYAVNMNHMRERHLDGTVLTSGAGGTVFESLARPDLLITDAERANVIGSRRKDRDAALIGMRSLVDPRISSYSCFI